MARVLEALVGKLTVVIVIVLALGVVVMAVASQYTESNKFCEVPRVTRWTPTMLRGSLPSTTRSTVSPVTSAPGLGNFLVAKFSALREVWVHVTGQVKAPIAVRVTCPTGCARPRAVIRQGVCRPRSPCIRRPRQRLCTPKRMRSSSASLVTIGSCTLRCPVERTFRRSPWPPALSATQTGPENCSYCHTAPHDNRGQCSQCHSIWAFAGGKNFQHRSRWSAHTRPYCASSVT